MSCINGNLKVDKKWQEAGAYLIDGQVKQAFQSLKNTSKVDKELTGKMFGKMSNELETEIEEFGKEIDKNLIICKPKFNLTDDQIKIIKLTVIQTMKDYLNRAQRIVG